VSEAPSVLTDPPWLRAAARDAVPERDPVIVAGLTPPADRRILWAAGEREEWAAIRSYGRFDEDDWDTAVQDHVSGAMAYPPTQAGLFARAPEHLVRPLLRDWRPEVTWDFAHSLKPIVARFAMDARDVAFPLARRNPHGTGEVLLPFLDAEVLDGVPVPALSPAAAPYPAQR
jgi:hypothetical protein